MLKITEPTWLHVIIPHMNGQLLIKQENIYIRYDTMLLFLLNGRKKIANAVTHKGSKSFQPTHSLRAYE